MSDTIYSAPGATFFSELDSAATGLVGTVGVRLIRKSDEVVVTARTTAGIVEFPAGSGRYVFTGTAPAVAGAYTVFWDTGTVTPSTTASDDLVVTYNLPTGGAEPPGGSRPYSYATLADVSGMIPGFTPATSSKPTASQVLGHISNVANELEAAFSVLDYQTPIPTTATASMDIMRSYVTIGAAYRTAMAMPQGKDSKHAADYGAEWRAILSSIESGRRELPDAPRQGGKRTRSAGGRSAPSEPSEDSTSTFTRDTTFTQR